MLKNERFIKEYELTNPTKLTPKGCVNNRLYSTLEEELNKPFDETLLAHNKVKVVLVNCVMQEEGGLIWEPQILDLSSGTMTLEAGFVPSDRAINIHIDEDGNKTITTDYELMKYDCGHFNFKWTEAVCIIVNSGKEIHEFLYSDNPYNEQGRTLLVNQIKNIFSLGQTAPTGISTNKVTKHINFTDYLKKNNVK